MNGSLRTVGTCAIASLALVATGCASYSEQTRYFRASLYANNSEEALQHLEKSSLARSSSDRVLFHMEKGMALYLGARYKEAAREWDLATRRIEELYSISISRQTASFLVSETMADYEGEAHERVLLPVFSALAFLSTGEPDSASVEARRTIRVLEELNKQNEGKNVYNRDAFAHYLAGMVLEAKRDWDAALIEYRRALEASEENLKWAKRLDVAAFAEAVGRVAEFRSRKDLLDKLRKDYPNAKWTRMPDPSSEAEVIAIYEAGKAPLKKTQDQMIGIDGGFVRISYPVFVNQFYSSSGARLDVEGVRSSRLETLQDVGAVTLQAWLDRKPKYIAKMTARAIAKGASVAVANRQLGALGGLAASVAASASEVADTRAWTTLPDQILATRMTVPAERDLVIRLVPDAGKPFQTTLRLRPGEKRLVRLRTFE